MTEIPTVVRPKGRLDSTTCKAFEQEMVMHVERGCRALILDFSDVSFISSAGLRVMLLVAKQLKIAGGRLTVCALSKQVKEVFDVTGCMTLLDVFPSHEAAAAHLAMR